MSYVDVGPVRQPKRRRWWVALLLMLLGGTGYLYVGRPRRYAFYVLVSLVTMAVLYHGLWGWMSKPVVYVVAVAAGLVLFLGFWIDVARLAVGQVSYMPRWYNRWWFYVGCGLAMAFVVNLHEHGFGLVQLGARSYSIPSRSMAPAILVGDIVIADTRAYDNSDPELGDIVIFRLPRDPTVDFVKRIVGLPGDKVQMVDGSVHINGVAVPREKLGDATSPDDRPIVRYKETLPNGLGYVTWDTGVVAAADNTQEFVVPEDHYFVLGDNRDNSSDSRFAGTVGFVPRENIYAQVGGVIWSKDWSRLGLRVQ